MIAVVPVFAAGEASSASEAGLAAVLGAGILAAAALLSRVGIIELVARGYAAMGYAFIALFALPLLTVGARKVWRSGRP